MKENNTCKKEDRGRWRKTKENEDDGGEHKTPKNGEKINLHFLMQIWSSGY